MRATIATIVTIYSIKVYGSVINPALAETLTCSTSSQGYRICQDQHGHRCIEWERDGLIIRDLTAHPPPGPDKIDECPMTPQGDHR